MNGPNSREKREAFRWHILKLESDDIDTLCESRERGRVIPRGCEMSTSNARGRVRGWIVKDTLNTERHRSEPEHLPELPAAEDANARCGRAHSAVFPGIGLASTSAV
jgi:hypothetical protein